MFGVDGLRDAHGDLPIREYGVIGNCRSAALVGRDGSIDWFCWPRFDSPAVFCRLLDAKRGGFLQVAAVEPSRTTRRYLDDTNVLETSFVTQSGELGLLDFMPVDELREPTRGDGVHAHWLVRQLRCTRGEIEVEIRFRPTFDYARGASSLQIVEGGALAEHDGQTLVLVSPAPLSAVDASSPTEEVRGRLRLREGDVRWLVLAAGEDASAGPVALSPDAAARSLEKTVAAWRAWIAQAASPVAARADVRRSALTLKLLTYLPTGAVVAAATTSLPERVGGVRNWDYRYTWLRDSALSLLALQRLGFHDEAMRFWRWISERLEGPKPLQIMYRVDGARDLDEQELGHLRGWRASRPVRIGNGAAHQKQGDIYGEILNSVELCQREMPEMRDEGFWGLVSELAAGALEAWEQPDRGIWEMRGPPRHFLQSKLMCWVALDRASRIAEAFERGKQATDWRAHASRMKDEILERGYDATQGAFTQSFGSSTLDASALLLPLVGLLPATDERMVRTVERVQATLTENGFVRRYAEDVPDGFPQGEGAFLLCTFWLVDNLALQGRRAEAQALYEKVLAHANDLGLLSEEIEPRDGVLLGNFPQAFSHLALINAALLLADSKTASLEDPPP